MDLGEWSYHRGCATMKDCLDCFCAVLLYSCHLVLISSASVKFLPYLSFIMTIFTWNVPLEKLMWSYSVMSDSLQHYGLHSVWNSPGQNTEVGRLSLFQGIFPTQYQTQIFRIAGRFFNSWAAREAQRILYWSQKILFHFHQTFSIAFGKSSYIPEYYKLCIDLLYSGYFFIQCTFKKIFEP